jgi:hypothetical protein
MEPHMQSEFWSFLNSIAQEVEAIIPCPKCELDDVYAEDGEADSKAYARATKAWQRGEFSPASRETVIAEMESVLLDANRNCPTCSPLVED